MEENRIGGATEWETVCLGNGPFRPENDNCAMGTFLTFPCEGQVAGKCRTAAMS